MTSNSPPTSRRAARAGRGRSAAVIAASVAAVLSLLIGALQRQATAARCPGRRRRLDRARSARAPDSGSAPPSTAAPATRAAGRSARPGTNLLEHPDSYAELGGYTFQTATAMGGLPYMTPLRITWGGHSAIAYKRDFGLGGGPIDGLPRVIDLWWQFAGRLGIPYENGLWSGPVRIERPPGDRRRQPAGPDLRGAPQR